MTFNKFINDNELLIHKLAHKYTIDNYEHDDLYQEGLTKLWEVFDNYNERYSPTTFITIVLNNHYKNLLTRSKTQKRQNYEGDEEIYDVYDFDFDMLPEDSKTYTYKELETLSKAFLLLEGHKYQVVIENVLKGYTYEQVGEYYGVTKQRIYQIYNEFINEVKGELE